MKKQILILIIFASVSLVRANTGWFKDYVKINKNNEGEAYFWIGSDPSFGSELNNHDFGNVSSIVITGCNMKYWSDGAERTGGAFYYKIMSEDGNTTIVPPVEIIWVQTSTGGNDFQGIKTLSIDLSNSLSLNTTYKLHVWAKSWGNYQGDSWLTNSGLNYVATFSYKPTSFTGNGNFNDPTKWNCGIPSNNSTALINGNAIITSGLSVNTLSISSPYSLTINSTSSMTVTGTLTNSAGNSGLIIKSDINGTGSLIHNTADVQATIERYITGSSTLTAMQYHQVSIPLTSAATPTSNLFVGSYLFDFTEAAGTHGDWNPLGNSTSTALDVNKGYLIYYPENTPITYTFAGPMRNGTVSPTITYADANHGFNLVPNPYPSAIDWTLIPTKTNLADAFWIWNPASSNYGAYGTAVGTGTSSTTQNIPVGQAFFVRATSASPALSLTNVARVHNSQPFLKNIKDIENILRLSVSGNNSSDEVLVAFNTTWSSGSDYADVSKMYGTDTSPQLSCIATDGELHSINSLPFTTGDAIVPLDFSLNATTDVTFTATGIESFYEGIPIYLEDHLLNKVVDLRTDPVYTFSHTAGSAGNRFLIRFMGVTGTPEHNTTTEGSAFVSNGHLYVDVPSMSRSEATISIYDMLGRQFSSRKIMLSGITELPAPAASGVYVVKILAGNKSFERKIVVNL